MKARSAVVTAPRVAAGVAVVVVLALPVLTDDLLVIRVATTAALFAVLAASWDLLSGVTGQVSFGHAAFVGVAGFTSALLADNLGWSADVTVPLGAVTAALFGLLIGVPALRLKGPYLALATLSAAAALYQLTFVFKEQTGGEDGISGLPTLDESAVLGGGGAVLARLFTAGASEELRPLGRATVANYYTTVVLSLLVIVLLFRAAHGRRGLVLRAIQQDETAAEAAGTPIARYKIGAFVLSGACAGLAGSLLVTARGSVGIDLLLVDLSLLVIVMSALGGVGTIIGPVVGAVVIIWLQDYQLDRLAFVEREPAVKSLLFAVVLLVVLRVLPGGLMPPALRLLGRLGRRTRQHDPPAGRRSASGPEPSEPGRQTAAEPAGEEQEREPAGPVKADEPEALR